MSETNTKPKTPMSRLQAVVWILAFAVFLLTVPNLPMFQAKPGQIAEASFEDKRAEKEAELEKIEADKAKLELEAKKINLEKEVLEVEESLKDSGVNNDTPQDPVTGLINNLVSVVTKTKVSDDKTELPPDNIENIQKYINRYFPKSPISAQMIMEASQKYNIPPGFILAVGHNESHMGTKGRAVATRNPFNVGNTDSGDYKAVKCGVANNCLNSWQAGLDAFTSLISRCYFNDGEAIRLQTWVGRDFRAVRCNIAGKRYMTDYRAKIKYAERIKNLNQFNINY
jgi:hypothetical protein